MRVPCVLLVTCLTLVAGCVGRTGKVGEPIAEKYQDKVAQMKLGQSTPEDLQRVFKGDKISQKDSKLEQGRRVEVWEVFRGGDLDTAQFLLWGQISHDKDQSMLFKFENGLLVSRESVIHPDK